MHVGAMRETPTGDGGKQGFLVLTNMLAGQNTTAVPHKNIEYVKIVLRIRANCADLFKGN